LTAQRLPGAVIEILRSPGRTPLLFVDIPAQGTATEATVLVYGHLDKQPEFQGWREGTGPWTPVFDGIRLFGRGSADDAMPCASRRALFLVAGRKHPGASPSSRRVRSGPRSGLLVGRPGRPTRAGRPRGVPRLGSRRL
jgi:hypothetical protein